MLWVLKSTASMRQFFWAPKTYATNYGEHFCLSKPVLSQNYDSQFIVSEALYLLTTVNVL